MAETVDLTGISRSSVKRYASTCAPSYWPNHVVGPDGGVVVSE